MSIFLECNEANHTCDKNQYKEASFSELIKLNIHVLFCSACRKYSARNGKLTSFVKKTDVKTMPLDLKLDLKERLKKQMSEQQ